MKIKTTITVVLVIVMAVEQPIYATSKSGSEQPGPSLVAELVFATIVLTVGLIIVWQLKKLCNRVLPNPPRPPQPTNAVPQSAGIGIGIEKQHFTIPATVTMQNMYQIEELSPEFNDPSGNRYTHILLCGIKSSANLVDWSDEGRFCAWFNDDYFCWQQDDTDGNPVKTETLQGWPTKQVDLIFHEDVADKRFFKIE